MRTSPLFLGLALAATASASVIPKQKTNSSGPSPAACEVIAGIVEDNVEIPFPPSLALDCLNSIPLDVEKSAALVDFLEPYLDFQSNLGDLRNPPEEYTLPGIDVIGGYEIIKKKALDGNYESQFEFVSEIYRLTIRAQDGHFNVVPALSRIFEFQRPFTIGLIAVSEDGTKPPRIYYIEDLALWRRESEFEPNPVVRVDGQDVVEWLRDLSTTSNLHDPDAQWNDLMQSVPLIARGEGNPIFTNPNPNYPFLDVTIVEFENGTVIEEDNVAKLSGVLTDWTGIKDGQDVFERVEGAKPTGGGPCGVVEPRTDGEAGWVDGLPPIKPLPLYPYPVDMHRQGGYMSGYFLNETGYDDVGVIAINGFAPTGDLEDINGTENVFEGIRFINSYFASFVMERKKRLVVDLSVNGGGFGALSNYLFRTIFPDRVPFDAYRLHATDNLDFIGSSTFGKDDVKVYDMGDENNEVYETWRELFGPVEIRGDNYTNLVGSGFEPLWASAARRGLIPDFGTVMPAGYLEPEDIILATDGMCASACPLFVGYMQREKGVRTVALGGRPDNFGPMQAMGGTKGGEVLPLATWQDAVKVALFLSEGEATEGLDLPSVGEPPLTLVSARINGQNKYAEKRPDIALQFAYEAANARLFYTFENALDITALWRDVADVAWNGRKCVPGSTTSKDDIIQDDTAPFSTAAYSKARFISVPGGYETAGENTMKRDVGELEKKDNGDAGRRGRSGTKYRGKLDGIYRANT